MTVIPEAEEAVVRTVLVNEEARRNCSAFYVCNVEEGLPFGSDEQFDFVVLADILEHLAEHDAWFALEHDALAGVQAGDDHDAIALHAPCGHGAAARSGAVDHEDRGCTGFPHGSRPASAISFPAACRCSRVKSSTSRCAC